MGLGEVLVGLHRPDHEPVKVLVGEELLRRGAEEKAEKQGADGVSRARKRSVFTRSRRQAGAAPAGDRPALHSSELAGKGGCIGQQPRALGALLTRPPWFRCSFGAERLWQGEAPQPALAGSPPPRKTREPLAKVPPTAGTWLPAPPTRWRGCSSGEWRAQLSHGQAHSQPLLTETMMPRLDLPSCTEMCLGITLGCVATAASTRASRNIAGELPG